MDKLDLWLLYARRGWRLAPMPRGAKHPPFVGWPEDATTDVADLELCYRDFPNHDIFLATGWRSGVWVLDVDGEDGEDALGRLERKHGPIPVTAEVVTANGRHVYFANPTDLRVPTTAGKIGRGLDVRGEGGGVAAPPSRGKAWDLGDGHDLTDGAVVAEAPEWLVEVVTRTSKRKASKRSTDLTTVMNRFNLEHQNQVAEMLVQLGGIEVDECDGYTLWRRPGKRSGHSASLGFIAPGVVRVFTSNWPPLADGIWNALQLWMVLNGLDPANDSDYGNAIWVIGERQRKADLAELLAHVRGDRCG